MEQDKFFPTANFGDSFGIFSHLLSLLIPYKKFKVLLYKNGRYNKKLTCDFPCLVQQLSSLEYETYSDIVVFGYPKMDTFESDTLFAIYYDFCSGHRCIRFYV